MIRLCPFALVLFATPALAAERPVAIGTVDRVRIDGVLKVTIGTGAAPSLVLHGEQRAIEAIDVRDDGGVLAIRARDDGGHPSFAPVTGPARPIEITVTTPALRGVTLVGGAVVSVGAMRASAVDLSVSGTGTLAVASVDTDTLSATLIGNGAIMLGVGRAGFARLVDNGGGTIDAGAVDAGDVVVHLDGVGSVKATARYTAQVIDGGLGSVSIAGAPKCTVKAAAGGPVSCGAAR